jgi:hypothetical protein
VLIVALAAAWRHDNQSKIREREALLIQLDARHQRLADDLEMSRDLLGRERERAANLRRRLNSASMREKEDLQMLYEFHKKRADAYWLQLPSGPMRQTNQ